MSSPPLKLYRQALAYYQAGELPQAKTLLQQLVRLDPDQGPAWHLLGLIAQRRGQAILALEYLDRAARLGPADAEIQTHRAELLRQAGRLDEALSAAQTAIRLQPRSAAAHNNLGLILQGLGRVAEAEASFRQAVQVDPAYPKAHYNLGNLLRQAGQVAAAENSLRQALRLQPGHLQARLALGLTLAEKGQFDEAQACFRQALRQQPNHPQVYLNFANVLLQQNRPAEALPLFQRALALRPDYPEAILGQGLALEQQKQSQQALACYQQALNLRPEWAEAHYNLGNVLEKSGQRMAAREAYQAALALRPDLGEALANLAHLQARQCDWTGRAEQIDQLKTLLAARLVQGRSALITPSFAVTFSFSLADQFAIAQDYAYRVSQRVAGLRRDLQLAYRPHLPQQRLRLGYLSADFRNHAVSHLLQGVFGLHRRDQFEIYAYSYGPDDGSDYRRRIMADCDHFIDLAQVDAAESARRINGDGIDILVDLMGHTGNTRPEIPALRPAPFQVNYLGFPATMGADFIDYLITDRVVTPPEQAHYYREQLVYLPHSYQANDGHQPIASTPASRAEEGLPESGFVFCCFNNSYKIEPEIFAVWMRILGQTPGSVLWLLAEWPEVRQNLRREAERRAIDPQRLIFGQIKPKPEHLARHRLADLFLDTPHCNAHTTASDSLWAGTPLLTCPGEAFATRVAASLLSAVGLPELIAADLDSYEREAIRLATQPLALSALKAKLTAHRTTYPLFDTPRYVRNLERAYLAMWDHYAAGQPPQHIVIEEPD